MDPHHRRSGYGSLRFLVTRWQLALLPLRARGLSLHLGPTPRPCDEAPFRSGVPGAPLPHFPPLADDHWRSTGHGDVGGRGQTRFQYGRANRQYLDDQPPLIFVGRSPRSAWVPLDPLSVRITLQRWNGRPEFRPT